MARPLAPDAHQPYAHLTDGGEINGPATVDFEAVSQLAAEIAAGRMQFPPNIEDVIAATPQEVFDATFRQCLDTVKLTAKSATLTDKRTLALGMTLRALAAAPPAPHGAVDAQIDPVKVEMYLRFAVDGLPERFTPAQRELLRDELWTLTSKEVAAAIQLQENTLAQWRAKGIGPKYLKLGNGKNSVRYPAAALIEWVQEQ